MSEVKLGYKMVWMNNIYNVGEGFQGATTLPEHARVHLRLGEVSVPQKGCGPITLFDSFVNAKKWWRQTRCFYQLYYWLAVCLYVPSKFKSAWYEDTAGERHYLRAKYFPEGTVLADAVQPITFLDWGRIKGLAEGKYGYELNPMRWNAQLSGE